MAITGTFQADFSQFLKAIEDADIKLRRFEDTGKGLKKSLEKMTNSFSGVKIAQEATLMTLAIELVGGASKLTAKELENAGAKAAEAAEKMKRMGLDVPPGLLRLAEAAKQAEPPMTGLSVGVGSLIGSFVGSLSAGVVTRWASEILDTAGKLKSLSERTDISTDALQDFNVIALQSGSSLDTVANAVFEMGKRLAGGNPNAASAVKELGLNFDELRKMRVEDAFRTIGIAIGDLSDPMRQSELGAKIFGRSVAELIPVFKHLEEGSGSYFKMTPNQISMLDSLGAAFTRAKASVVPFTVAMAEGFGVIGFIEGMSKGVAILRGSMDDLPKVVGATRDSMESLWTATKKLTLTVPDLNHALIEQKSAERELEAEHRKQVAAADKFAAAMKEVNSASSDVNATVTKLGPVMVALIEDSLKAGISQADLAIALKKTATEIRDVALAMAERNRWAETEATQRRETEALEAETSKLKLSRSASLREQQIGDIEAVAAKAKRAAQDRGTDDERFYNAVTARSKAARDAIEVDRNFLQTHSRAYYEDEYQRAKATYEAMTLEPWKYSRETMEAYRQVVEDAKEKASGFADAWKAAHAAAAAAAKEATNSIMQSQSMAQAALTGDLNSNVKNVHTLGGEWITAAEAKKRFDMGGSFAVPTITITDQNKTSYIARLKQIESTYKLFPGRQQGNNGPTGLLSNDAQGWSEMLREQVEYASLKAALPGYEKGGRNLPGGLALVGEGGPEVVRLPQGSDVIPNRELAGGVTILNTFNIVDTEANIARRVAEHLTRSLMQGRRLAGS